MIMKNNRMIFCSIENLILNAGVYAFFYFVLPVKEDFFVMNMHPLLIVTAIFAIRYGIYLGAFSAAISSVTFFLAYYSLGRDPYIFFIDFQFYKFLLMFFGVSIILGRFKDSYFYNSQLLEIDKKALEEENNELTKQYEEISRILKEQKKQIVGAEYSLVSLYEMASSLNTDEPEQIFTETVALLVKFLKAKTVSIYTVDQEYLRIKVRLGDFVGGIRTLKIENLELIQKVIDLKVCMKGVAVKSDFSPLFIAPIIKNEETVAIINVEDMEFDQVTEYNYTLFKVIIQWVNESLIKALEYDDKLSQYDGERSEHDVSYEKFEQILSISKDRKKRFDLEYCVLKYKLNNEIEKRNQEINVIRRFFRRVDVVSYHEPLNVMYILLPATHKEVINPIEKRLFQKLGYALESVT